MGAVESLEALEEHQQLLDVLEAQPAVDAEQRMRHRVRDAMVVEVVAQLVDVVAQALDVAVLPFVDAEHQAVDRAAVLGKAHRDLAGEEGARQVRDLERAVDGVVIGEGDQRHVALATAAVDHQRIGVALGRADPLEQPLGRPIGEAAVNVQVGLGV